MLSHILGSLLLFAGLAGAVVLDSPEAFFYNAGYTKGYEIGKKQGYVEGYRQALEDVKKVLQAYKVDVEALEAGKYLYKQGLVTYPRVFRVKDEGGYRIVVKGCQIEDVRSLDHIFSAKGLYIPVLSIDEMVAYREAQTRLIRFPELSRKVEETTRVPPKPIFIRVSPSAVSLLEEYNIPYVLRGVDGSTVEAVFFSQKEADEFCQKHKDACSLSSIDGGSDELEEY